VACLIADDHQAEYRRLPRILLLHFSHRDIELSPQPLWPPGEGSPRTLRYAPAPPVLRCVSICPFAEDTFGGGKWFRFNTALLDPPRRAPAVRYPYRELRCSRRAWSS
jgi:hypothetical protein